MVKVLNKDLETLPATASKEYAFVNIELFNHDRQTFEVTIRLFARYPIGGWNHLYLDMIQS
jgi:hypothetical protein